MAIVLPLVAGLLAGIIDFSLALNDLQTTRQETREITRDAVVGTSGNDTGCSHLASPLNDSSIRLMCETKSRVGTDARVKVAFPDAGGYLVGNAVQVCVQLPYQSLTGFFTTILDGNSAKVKVESRIEVEMDTPLEPFQEPSLPGESWGFCA